VDTIALTDTQQPCNGQLAADSQFVRMQMEIWAVRTWNWLLTSMLSYCCGCIVFMHMKSVTKIHSVRMCGQKDGCGCCEDGGMNYMCSNSVFTWQWHCIKLFVTMWCVTIIVKVSFRVMLEQDRMQCKHEPQLTLVPLTAGKHRKHTDLKNLWQ
jgi:hypothetical protein